MIITARNDDVSTMTIGTISILSGATISLFDSDGLDDDQWNNMEQFCLAANIGTINQNIGSANLVIIKDSVDQTVQEGFDVLQYIREVCDCASDSSEQEMSNVAFSKKGMKVTSGSMLNIKTATFNSWQLLTASTSSVTVEFDEYQKATIDLNDQASITITLNEPKGPGNFMLILKQGSTTPTTTYTWATEGTHAIKAPSGSIATADTAGDITMLGLAYDGTDWYVVSSQPMENVIAS